MFEKHDRLLAVLSAKQQMSWATWKKVFDYLRTTPDAALPFELDKLRYERADTLRAFEALGHCDVAFDENGDDIFIAPAALVRLPLAGLAHAVLAGRRTPQTIQQLSEACHSSVGEVRVEIAEQHGVLRLLPARVLVRATVETIAQLAATLQIAFEPEPAAWRILHFAGALDDYLASCVMVSELNWPRRDFMPEALQFRCANGTGQELRLSHYTSTTHHQSRCLFWQQGKALRVERDWGRYALLNAAGLNVLIYDAQKLRLAVPANAPLPRLLARGLALCSGYAARFLPRERLPHAHPEQRGFVIFQDVPPPLAELAATKAGQTLLPYSLDLSFSGAKR